MPPGLAFKGYEDFVVQDLEIRPRVTRYRRERWRSPDGRNLVAPLPEGVRPESHFGSTLISFIISQYHYQHVTQPLLLEQLDHLGIDISAGQLNGILTEKKDVFHDEKTEVLLAGLEVSSYVQVDDTGARHQGHNGFCTHIGNELFAYFESTDSKSRQNFLEVLRGPYTDYTINDAAVAYWQRHELAQAVIERLTSGASWFADEAAWKAYLAWHEVTRERHVRIATEGALLGSLIAHGVSPEMGILSDGAGQFDVFVHALCWLHVERPLERLVPHNEKHRQAIERIRQRIWDLYTGLKAYQQAAVADGAGRVGQAVRRVGRQPDRLPLDRWGAQRDGGGSRRSYCWCSSAPRCRCTTTSARDTSGTTSRSGRSAAARGVTRVGVRGTPLRA